MEAFLGRFRRITSSGRFVPEIDGLRFAAIASVVLYHFHGFLLLNKSVTGAQDSFAAALQHGYRGVNLFYVISGFVLGLPLAERYLKAAPGVPLKRYFLRRLTRLEPPYILNLLICSTLLIILEGMKAQAVLPHLAASLVYLHTLWFGQQSLINPVAWTLEVEVQFYLLAPVLGLMFRVPSRFTRRVAFTTAILLAGILQMTFWNPPDRIRLTILYAIQFFLAGLLLADIYVLDWNQRPGRNWRWDVVSLVCWPLVFLPGDLPVWAGLPFLMLAACVGAFQGNFFGRLFRNPVIITAGGMCYTIYLFHYQLITPVLRISRRVHLGNNLDAYFALQFMIYGAVLLVVSGVYFAAVERPCMRKDWPRQVFGQLKWLSNKAKGAATVTNFAK
ncbi:MAG TPA: acyltransferase [Bryobacteraceae bacterium]|nr:acyltransferase [Bryobacteraceae bacterium]